MNDQVFEEVEALVEPIINSNSKRFYRSLGMTVEDARQEARLALFLALRNYDYNKTQGGIFNFARTSIRNYFLKSLYSELTQKRRAHVVYEDEEGNRQVLKMNRPDEYTETSTGFTELCRATILTPEDQLHAAFNETRVRELQIRLLSKLGPRERAVFNCRSEPPPELLSLMFDDGETEATIPLIARHLGLSKNAVDWSLAKIRHLFVSLVESEEFSDLSDHLVVRGHWPMIHETQGEDTGFVKKVIEDRHLDPKTTDRDVMTSGNGHRIIENYQWGAAMFLTFKDQSKTMVLEGRFNARKGTLHSDTGAWKHVYDRVPWYKQLKAEISI